jgi:hypothetical protein
VQREPQRHGAFVVLPTARAARGGFTFLRERTPAHVAQHAHEFGVLELQLAGRERDALQCSARFVVGLDSQQRVERLARSRGEPLLELVLTLLAWRLGVLR